MSLACLSSTAADRAEPSPKSKTAPGGRISAAIKGIAAWAPGIEGAEQWRAWAQGSRAPDFGAAVPQPSGVDAMLRRRLAPLARAGLAMAEAVLPVGQEARLVFASRHGDLRRTLGLLEAIADDQPLSPTAFGLSVHNALPGLWSIARQDRSANLALAAGEETFPWALVEAMSELAAKPDSDVVLLYADDPMPEAYAVFESPAAPPLALALRLAARGPVRLEAAWATEGGASTEPAALAFLRAWFGASGDGAWQAAARRWSWSWHAEN